MKKGSRHSPEAREKIRAAREAQEVWNKGISVPRSTSSRRKQAETVRAKWADPDWRAARGKTVITYSGVHTRLFRLAKQAQTCQAHLVGFPSCNAGAKNWAIRHDTPDLLVDPKGRPYSMRVEDYARLCLKHHALYDGACRKEWLAKHGNEALRSGRVELMRAEAAEIKKRRADGETLAALAAEFRLAVTTIWRIVHELSWSDLDEEEKEE